MNKNITKETINTIKDGAVVELGANAEIKIIGKSVVLTIDGKTYDWDEDYIDDFMDNGVKLINAVIGTHNTNKLYNIINRLFTEMDYNLTFEFGGFTLGLADTEDDAMWWEKGIYVIPTDAKEEDGEWDWDAATFYTIEPYFRTYADLLRGDRDIIGDMANTVLRDMETVTPHLSTGGTTETHKTVVVE
jgi:hypothetical protein